MCPEKNLDLLKDELKFFEDNKSVFLEKYKGLFVLIKSQKLIGAFATSQDAYDRGVTEFGREPFLIKQVLESEPHEIQPALFNSLLRARI
jgi:hypothetical protein